MANLIQENESLNKGRVKINTAIEQAERAENKAIDALAVSSDAMDLSVEVKEQLDTIVISGDSSIEAAQARVDMEGKAYNTLKSRLDTEHSEVVSQLAQNKQQLESDIQNLDSVKVDKNGSGQVTYAMFSQDAREQITGGNTAVVGLGGVLEENLTDGVVTPVKTDFFDLPQNHWTEGNVIVTGTGTWKNTSFNKTGLPSGDYTFYINKATGYESSMTYYAQIQVRNVSDDVVTKNINIGVNEKYATKITLGEGQYFKVTFFLSHGISITDGKSVFTGIYLFKGDVEALLNAKIKSSIFDKNIIFDNVSNESVMLAENFEVVITATNPNAYKYTQYTYQVEPLREYFLDIGSFSGTKSPTIAVILLLDANGNTISQKPVTTNKTSIITTENTDKLQVNFYLTFESSASGTLTATFSNVDIYSKGILNKRIVVGEDNLTEEVKDKLESIATSDFYLYLPKEFVVAKGRIIDIYNKQVCHTGNLDNYHFRWKSPIGSAYARKFTIDSNSISAGNYTVVLEVYDNNLNLVATGQTTVKIINKSTNNTVKTLLPIGDSLTDIDKWRKELKTLADTMYSATKINYIGTKGTDPLYKHEGMSGWKTSHFVSNADYTYGGNIILTVSGVTDIPVSKKQYTIPDNQGGHVWEFEKAEGNQYYFNRVTNGSYTINSTGTITEVESSSVGDSSITYTSWEWQPGNSFWNPTTNQIDFNYYLSQNGFTQPDYVSIFLGTNDLSIATGKREELVTAYSNSVANLKKIVDKILSQWAGTKIMVVLPPYFAGQDGYKNADRFELQQHLQVYTMTELIYEQFKDYHSNVAVVPVAQTMDADYVFGQILTPVNPRMTDVTVPMPKEVTHPQPEGFWQMADIIFGHWLDLE